MILRPLKIEEVNGFDQMFRKVKRLMMKNKVSNTMIPLSAKIIE